VQSQPDFRQPFRQRRPHLEDLALGRTVHHRIISEPLELNGRELPLQP
jgi:hypothetical protein